MLDTMRYKSRVLEMLSAIKAQKLDAKCFDLTPQELRASVKNARRVIRESDNIERIKRAELRLARAVIQVLG